MEKADFDYLIKFTRTNGTKAIRHILTDSDWSAIEVIKSIEGPDNIKTLAIIDKRPV